jgi:hypothetical protein
VARALNALGLVEMMEGDLSLACVLHEESLALSREVGDRWAIAWALTNLGVDLVTLAKLGQGDGKLAEPLFEEALTIWLDLGERRHLAFTHMNMAHCALQQGDFSVTAQRLDLSIEMFTDLDEGNGLFLAGSTGASLLWALDRHAHAVRLIAATYGRAKATTGRTYRLKESWTEHLLDEARGILGPERFETAWTAGCAMSLPEAVASLRQQLTVLAL